MLVLKRTLATVINLGFFIVVVLIIYPLFNRFNISIESKYYYTVFFCISFLFPLIIFKNSIGHYILKIHNDNFRKLYIKYLIYFIIFSGVGGRIIGLIINIFHSSSLSKNTHVLPSLYFFFTFILFTWILFYISRGKYNLVDYILRIVYDSKNYKRNPVTILIIWFSYVYTIAVLAILSDQSKFKDTFSFFIEPTGSYFSTSFFPRDLFSNYSNYQIEKRERNNEIFTTSDYTSFYQDRYLNQKTIYALINKFTFESDIERLKFCYYLESYSSINDIVNKIFDFDFSHDNDVDQTRIILIYNKPHTFFTKKSFVYEYYYDNKNPTYSIYGGVVLDSLIAFHKRQNNEYFKSYMESLAEAINITIDSLMARVDKNGIITYTKSEIQKLNSTPYKVMPKENPLVLSIVPFIAVKPKIIYTYSIPEYDFFSVELFDKTYFNDNFFEAIFYRNVNYYRK